MEHLKVSFRTQVFCRTELEYWWRGEMQHTIFQLALSKSDKLVKAHNRQIFVKTFRKIVLGLPDLGFDVIGWNQVTVKLLPIRVQKPLNPSP